MLRTALIALAALAATPLAQAQEARGELTINITGLAPQGAVLLQVFDSEAAYQSGNGGTAHMAPVTADTASVVIADLAPGQYAFRLFHDVNGNGQFDTNPFGIPTEPFAFSNGARGRFGPAPWSDAAFTLSAGANVQVVSLGAAQ